MWIFCYLYFKPTNSDTMPWNKDIVKFISHICLVERYLFCRRGLNETEFSSAQEVIGRVQRTVWSKKGQNETKKSNNYYELTDSIKKSAFNL